MAASIPFGSSTLMQVKNGSVLRRDIGMQRSRSVPCAGAWGRRFCHLPDGVK